MVLAVCIKKLQYEIIAYFTLWDISLAMLYYSCIKSLVFECSVFKSIRTFVIQHFTGNLDSSRKTKKDQNHLFLLKTDKKVFYAPSSKNVIMT